ncbi:MAG: ABC-2 family transporter protein [Clostridia bacterium]|nr:ABC-2 family transporter protein [Clostridia bacterium]
MKLYFKYFSIHLKSVMQYKVSFLLTVFSQLMLTVTSFLGIHFMFARFHTVEGFTYNEVLFCCGVVLLSFCLAECIARGFDTFASMIGNGEFDRILVRPRNEILQVLGTRIEFTRVGRMLMGIVMFVYAANRGGIPWDVPRVITLLFMILGGTTIFCGLFLLYAGFCFFTLEGLEFMNIFTDGMYQHGRYPLSVYGKRVLQFCTYIIPFSLVQYYPLMYVLGKGGGTYCIFLPLLAMLFLIPCWIFWRVGVRKYTSTGS